jgi:hypothetical protein
VSCVCEHHERRMKATSLKQTLRRAATITLVVVFSVSCSDSSGSRTDDAASIRRVVLAYAQALFAHRFQTASRYVDSPSSAILRAIAAGDNLKPTIRPERLSVSAVKISGNRATATLAGTFCAATERELGPLAADGPVQTSAAGEKCVSVVRPNASALLRLNLLSHGGDWRVTIAGLSP